MEEESEIRNKHKNLIVEVHIRQRPPTKVKKKIIMLEALVEKSRSE
jgi:hypothetical protein